MGAAQSSLKNLWFAIKMLLSMNEDFQKLLKRANAPPGLPVPNPTISYWLEDPPYPDLVNKQSPQMPTEADVVIIGSGITGAAVARSLLHESARKNRRFSQSSSDNRSCSEDEKEHMQDLPRIVVLEARSLCSGATGRNGGHIKSSPHELFANLRRQKMSNERAAALVRFQLAHVEVLTNLCKSEGWDLAECREVETANLYINDEAREKGFKLVRDLRKWVPELEIKMWNAEEARERFKTNNHIVGAISYTAGALWPFHLVSCVWKSLLDSFEQQLFLETGTAVTSIQTVSTQSSHGFSYEVTTDRGSIRCNHIVHATNGFTTQFVPGLRNKMTGVLAHMSAQRPGKSFPIVDGARSWSVMYNPSFDYITQRPNLQDGAPGDLMIGGGMSLSQNGALSSVGVWDDSKIDPFPTAHLSGIFPTIFEPHWGEEAVGGRTKNTWTGIVCITGDMRPFVGRLDSRLTSRPILARETAQGVKPGEWVAAGYCGDGMVWAWLSGIAIGLMLSGSEDEDLPKIPGMLSGRLVDWFPNELEPTARRLKNANLENLIDLL
ncbi:FAD dependent oxidoreductase [Xylariaceae sp. FL0255]|nr:FAD dependent oxidoreductase [Xylariaceae sp. FL0255]